MATSLVNVRLDDQTKRAMSEICAELGLSMSAAFNIFAKTMVRERRIPFESLTTLNCRLVSAPVRTES